MKCVTVSRQILSSTTVSTLIIIRNVSWASNHNIRVISEGSCDTEDWSNDTENSALIRGINYIIKHIQIEDLYFTF